MNPTSIVNAWITSLIRMVLAIAGGFLIRKGYVDSSLWEATVGAIVGAGITAFWSLFEKYRVKAHIQTALNMPQGSSVSLLSDVISTGVPVLPSDTTTSISKKVNATALALILISALIFQVACTPNFGRDLRLALAVSAPFIDSLNLGSNKAKIIADFVELGGDAATFGDAVTACKGVKSCELTAVQTLDNAVEPVLNRDFGINPTLQRIEGVVRGIIAAAKVYYSPPSITATAAPVDKKAIEKDIAAQIKELKTLTHNPVKQ